MCENLVAKGWPSDWLNGWMASVGVTRDSDIRLSFTKDTTPLPVFTKADGSTVTAEDINNLLPKKSYLDRLQMYRDKDPSEKGFTVNPTDEQYGYRAGEARRRQDYFLGASITDLATKEKGEKDNKKPEKAHSPFHPPEPNGVTLAQRVAECIDSIGSIEGIDSISMVEKSLTEHPTMVEATGVGFDSRSILSSSALNKNRYVDPVVEVFTFMCLPMFPVRGHGQKTYDADTRGWTTPNASPYAFTWPVWKDPLTWGAIDALLDQFWNTRPRELTPKSLTKWAATVEKIGVFGAYGSIAYRATKAMTRGYSSRELWMTT